MSTQSMDTAPEIERIQIARLRGRPVARIFAAIRADTAALAAANLQAADGLQPRSECERAGQFVARQYGLDGAALAADVLAAIQKQPAWSLGRFDLGQALRRVTEALSRLDAPYALVGQLACALYGFPRPVFTVKILADVPAERADALAAQLYPDILVRDAMVSAGTPEVGVIPATDAYEGARHQSRNPARMPGRVERAWSGTPRWLLVHLSTLVGVEILHLGPWPAFAHRALRRARLLALEDDSTWQVRVAIPEDVVLLDLLDLADLRRRAGRWNDPQTGGRAALWDDDRWNDLRGVLKVQAPTLDLALLDREVVQLEGRELLHRALADAGLPSLPDQPGLPPGPGPARSDGQSCRR